MKSYPKQIFLLLCTLLLSGCAKEQPVEGVQVPKPGTAAHFYELGLESQDPEKKLEFYEQGLDAVEDVTDTVLVALLEGKVYALSRLGENHCSLVWIDSLIEVAQLQGDLFYEAKGYYRKSIMNRHFNQKEKEFENAFRSRQVYLQMGDTGYAGRRCLDMANAQIGMGDFSGAQETATEALKFLDKEVDSAYVSSAYNVIGLAYSELGFYEEAKKEYENALKFAVRREDSLSYLHNKALAFKNEKNYDAALKIFRGIIDSQEPDLESRNRFRDNYAFTKWLKDPAQEVHPDLLDVLEERKLTNDGEGLMASYSHLTEYYNNKDREKAREYAAAYLAVAEETRNRPSEVAALKKLISLSQGEAKEAYVDRYLFLNDSLTQANLKAKFHFAKVRLDEERKQQQIKILEAENLTHSIKAERLKTGNVISSLSAILFLLVAGSIYYYFSQRGRKEKIKQIYLTENRISKRIHDELANDIYNAMSALEPAGPSPVVDQLEKIYNRTRDFSRENSEIETGEGFLKGLMDLLSSTTPRGTKLIIRGEEEIDWKKLRSPKKIVLYRVLQEMMVNMKKHSGATLVALVFSSEKGQLKVNYSDNGKGVNETELLSGNGVKNLQARLQTLGGKAIFETEGKGLKVQISIPFSS